MDNRCVDVFFFCWCVNSVADVDSCDAAGFQFRSGSGQHRAQDRAVVADVLAAASARRGSARRPAAAERIVEQQSCNQQSERSPPRASPAAAASARRRSARSLPRAGRCRLSGLAVPAEADQGVLVGTALDPQVLRTQTPHPLRLQRSRGSFLSFQCLFIFLYYYYYYYYYY